MPLLLISFAGVIALQIVLSRRERRWPGLILPVLWLIWTLVVTVPQMALLMGEGMGWTQAVLELGLPALALENVPSLILLAVYAACHLHRRRSRKKQLKKTRIDDL